MHPNNERFLAEAKQKYPHAFNGAKVLELGSGLFGMKPVLRNLCENCEYVGVDIKPDKGVDIVCAAKDTVFEIKYFDTLFCLSMFEHDPDWQVSFKHNLQWVRPGGMIFLCWGAEGNKKHTPKPWNPIPVKDFMEVQTQLPIKIIDCFFEEQRYNNIDCSGAYDVIAIKL